MQGKTIIGRDRQNDIYDFYETPKWATERVVEAPLNDNIICKDSYILEPCSGAGAIVNVLNEYGFTNVKASDIQTLDCIVGNKGIDIANLPSNYCDIIITNINVKIAISRVVLKMWTFIMDFPYTFLF